MTEKLIDVEEAAAHLGLSQSRVRTLCGDGALTANKVGGQWTIEAKSVRIYAGKTAKQRARRQSSKLDIDTSLTQIKNELRLQFVPELLRLEDLVADRNGLKAEIRRRIAKSQFPASPIDVVESAKDEINRRPGSVLHPVDWVIYHAAVARIAPTIDNALSNAVYSSRVNRTDSRYLARPFAKQYAAWQRATRRTLTKGGYSFMLSTDIVAYYEQIGVDDLYPLVAPFDHGGVSWPIIREMLRDWTQDMRGLPQGPEASAILGNLYLKPLDDLLDAIPSVTHLRYMDDIRVFATDRRELIRVAGEMQRLLRSQKLDIKSDKTELLTASDALAQLEDSEKDLASYLMKVDRPKARKHIRSMVRSAVRRSAGPDRRTVEFGLRRLRRLGDGYLLKLVMENIDKLPPSGQVIAQFVSQFPNRKGVHTDITNFLCDTTRNLWPQYEMWLLFALAEATTPLPGKLMDRCRRLVRDTGKPWWLRAAALDVLLTDSNDATNARAISDGLRNSNDLQFYRQASALFLQRQQQASIRQLRKELRRLNTEHSQRLDAYLDLNPKAPDRWLGN